MGLGYQPHFERRGPRGKRIKLTPGGCCFEILRLDF